MPLLKFVRDGWGHKAGDEVEFVEPFATTIEVEGYAVPAGGQPKVERAVAQEPDKRTAKLER